MGLARRGLRSIDRVGKKKLARSAFDRNDRRNWPPVINQSLPWEECSPPATRGQGFNGYC